MTNSPKLGLQLMSENVLQKEIIFNETIITIDVLLARTVTGFATSPPSSPADGDAYVIGPGATGLFSGHDNAIAFWYNGWHFVLPPVKYRLYITASSGFYTLQLTGWTADPAGTPSVLGDLTDVAVGTVVGGQVLKFDGSTSKWVPSTPLTALLSMSDVISTGVADGMFLRYSTSDNKFHAVAFPTVPTTLSALSDYDVAGEHPGYIAYWSGTHLTFADPSTLITLHSIDQIGDVSTTTAVTGDVLAFNGTVWGPSHAALTYSFASMSDGPGSMVGRAGKFLRVNSIETALEYAVPPSSGGGGSTTLAGDTDVVLASVTDGDVLTYSASSSKWHNAAPVAGTGGGTGGGTTPAVGSHKYWRLTHLQSGDGTGAQSAAAIDFRATSGGSAQAVTSTSSSPVYGAGYDSSKAQDSDPTTFWNSSVGGTGIYYEAYFATAVAVREIAIMARNDGYAAQTPQYFKVWYSDDGLKYKLAVEELTSVTFTAGLTQTFSVPA